ncbi:TnsD family Tn7-like transposition protein [Paenibacillus sp. MBLB4367]|uniref:TnsD family Tn7-like transposition protein n=1 Tax=Paenibacillus sp. MBLB4367 TaxID=3384767 RepID=UPI0039083D58
MKSYNDEHPLVLPRFPTPYPDELLYSIIARYHLWSSNLRFKHTIEDLFGTTRVGLLSTEFVDFPNFLNKLSERLPDKMLTPNDLISMHTFIPLIQPFLEQTKVDLILENMGNEYRSHLGGLKIKHPTYFRFCSSCIESDIDNFGEPYWHRSHQVLGVEICHYHREWLKFSQVKIGVNNLSNNIYPLNSEQPTTYFISEKKEHYREFYEEIADGVHWLLNNEQQVLGVGKLHQKYIYYLRRLGCVDSRGIQRGELTKRFLDRYDCELLKQIDCFIDIKQKTNWLTNLLIPCLKKPIEPVRHLLLIGLIGITPEQFFAQEPEYHDPLPFGEGPWICINPAADHYKKAVINKFKIFKTKSETKCMFFCECGFVYSRATPFVDDPLKWMKNCFVISYGHVWENEVVRLFEERKQSVSQIAKELNVSISTINKYKNRKGMKTMVNKADRKTESFLLKRSKHRSNFLRAINLNKDMGRHELKQLVNTEITWLRRHDDDWLNQHLPKPKRGGIKREYDWKKRDEDVKKEVIAAIERLRSQNGKPIRLTKRLIAVEIGKVSLLKCNLHKLPKTRKILDELIESPEDYQILRIKWAINHLEERGEALKPYKILAITSLINFLPKASDWLKKELLIRTS